MYRYKYGIAVARNIKSGQEEVTHLVDNYFSSWHASFQLLIYLIINFEHIEFSTFSMPVAYVHHDMFVSEVLIMLQI